jgi:hypothetical protein
MSIFDVTLPPAVEALVAELTADPEVREAVKPSVIPTTRGDYGRWLALLPALANASPLSNSTVANRRIWAVILDRAGADRRGLLDALRIIEG